MTDRHIDRTKKKPECRSRDNQMARRLQPAERMRELGAIALEVFNDININHDIIPSGWRLITKKRGTHAAVRWRLSTLILRSAAT